MKANILVALVFFTQAALAQEVTAPPAAAPTVEPGLEAAVKWRWQPQASEEAAWGFQIEVKSAAVPAGAPAAVPTPATGDKPIVPVRTAPAQALEHVIGRGETLSIIAQRYVITVEQIKKFNDMQSDKILVGKKLRIPGVDEIKAMTPALPLPKAEPKAEEKKKDEAPPPPPPPAKGKVETTASLVIATRPRRAIPSLAWGVASLVRTQAFLDRQGFTIGPIDGTPGPTYNAAFTAYDKAHPGEMFTANGQPTALLQAIGGAFVEYTLRGEDLRWITPVMEGPSVKKRGAVEAPPITLDSLTTPSFLAYRSAWEFVAERFHASESFLRRINPGLKNAESPGAVFLVPNVVPFEIENAFTEPLRPAADPAAPLKAAIIELRRFVIRRGDKLIASMPISVARPGLRGKGTWLILESILRPRLISNGTDIAPFPSAVTLPPGPNNPVGLAWMQLAKATDLKPLPYGLHGTSIPGHMTKQESVGGFRLTNWDLARVLRLLPVGTELAWE